MGTPLGDFIRARRDSIQPQSLGLPDHGRRRAPGLRRSDLAGRAGISVEYLTRLEQGRDRNPSVAVVNAVADALSLSASEREHLRFLSKITGGECTAHARPAPPLREVRPQVLETLRLLEPGIAMVTNRLGDVLARTSAYESVTGGTGLLDSDAPNLTRYVFTDPRARTFFADWDAVADEQAFDLWLAPSIGSSERLTAELAPVAGPDFTRRLNSHEVPRRGALRLKHPAGGELRLLRETLDLASDAQQLVVFLPADEETSQALARLPDLPTHGRLRAIS
ncbi:MULTISPECIES: helix-turn-helix domain-containing protein [Streptomyces]|uniref:Helix-turn-helix transcriptional regulator n=1 Tax=Streptomyces glycanivorans TaxID=3033808 RepID=A0ABY9JF68_9ACTN|nr:MULTISPECIES: helix-turn-helix transcriptional regulator [unclassified Streptomyces]WSQ79848.1 helix-turn-helix transcriptional regulator [Streptomyces sp. NBC_01213]TXS09002.1 helix-turn-helix domain-containing protein [Streptomyces sp. wa22]WLQ66397.1 helix-turn-helix transcriptional regulator [Streptomyces sp. Alt3]WSQ87228.1 helix-turn-helix transcriptional regulator [Streptomyces sp. NBC_01212]WSR06756.1 helix-turn-helix transcriptional regulator [Streptomyces sp. NBC_01208]